MTKISDLAPVTNLESSASIPIRQGSSTYHTNVSSMNGAAAGVNTSFGGIVSPDVLYGVPSAITLMNGGLGYSNDTTYAMAHGDPGVNGVTSGVIHQNAGPTDQKNPKKYIARGMHVKVVTTSAGGQIVNFEMTNPGQLYKVGDELQLSSWQVKYTTDGNDAATHSSSITSPATFKVAEIEPFMKYPGMQNCLGGSMENLYAMGSATPYDPAVAVSDRDGVSGYKMEEDASASLFLSTVATESQSDFVETAQRDAGFRSTWLGWPRVGNERTTNGGSPPDMSMSGNETEEAVADFSLSIALPGDWFVVAISQAFVNIKGGTSSHNHNMAYVFPHGQAPAGGYANSTAQFTAVRYDEFVHILPNVYGVNGVVKSVGGWRSVMRMPDSVRSYAWVPGQVAAHANSCQIYHNPHMLSQNHIDASAAIDPNVYAPMTNNVNSRFFDADGHLGVVGELNGSSKTYWGVWDAATTTTTSTRGREGKPNCTIYGSSFSTPPKNQAGNSPNNEMYAHGHSFFLVPAYALLAELEENWND